MISTTHVFPSRIDHKVIKGSVMQCDVTSQFRVGAYNTMTDVTLTENIPLKDLNKKSFCV